MFEIFSHKVTSILRPSEAKIWPWSVLNHTVAERAVIWGFGSTVGYNVTPHYRVLGLTACYRNLQKKLSLKIEAIFFYDPTNL